MAKDIAEQILSAKQGESLFGAVSFKAYSPSLNGFHPIRTFLYFQINAASLQGALRPETGPWLNLGTALAKAALGLTEKNIQKAVITTYGAALEKAASYVVPSVLMGLIPGITQTSNTLNLINGEYFAKEIGLQVLYHLRRRLF